MSFTLRKMSRYGIAGATIAGDVRNYQGWYRDALIFCMGNTYNLTQALSATGGP